MNRKNILILEPDRDVSELFARALEARKDCKCYMATKGEEAIDLLKDIPFHLVLADLSTVMNKDFGVLRKIRRLFPDTTIIIDAYLHQKEHLCKALTLGAHAYIYKPIKIELFRKRIDELCVTGSTRGVIPA